MPTRSPNPVNAVATPSPNPEGAAAVSQPVSEMAQRLPNRSGVPASVRFSKQMNGLVEKSKSKAALFRGIASVLNSTGCQALWVVSRESLESSELWSQPKSLLGDDSALLEVLATSIQTVQSLVLSGGSLVLVQPPTLTGYTLLAAPIVSGESITDILITLQRSTNHVSNPIDWPFMQAAEAISIWQMRQFINSSRQQLASLSGFVNMSAAMNRTDNRLDAAITLVNELKVATNSGLATLMLRSDRSGSFKLAAMSGVEFFDRNTATTQTIESTVLGIKEEPCFWNMASIDEPGEEDHKHQLNANLRNFCNLFGAAGCALLPLRDGQNHIFGWLLLTMSRSQCDSPQIEKHFRQISSLVAGQMNIVLKSQRTMTRVCLNNVRRTLTKRVIRKIGILFAVVVIGLCIPFSYKIACDCELQLTSRRFVAAPFEGLLEKTLVSNGDVVKPGQTLALMDASELRMKLSGLTADQERESKKRDSALARGQIAESQIAQSELAQLNSEIAIIQDRLANTEIRSPVQGVIVSGDLDKAQGAPMEMGQNLFEVGPLENMLVEIHVPEYEIQYVNTGMKVRFEFEAFPFETFEGNIQRIHPRAEVINSQSVFVAEINLDNSSGQLRPGLKGRARIYGDRHPLGWNLFHKSVEKARQWLIW